MLEPKKEPETESPQRTSKNARWAFRLSERRALLIGLDVALINIAIFVGLWIWTLGDVGPLTEEFLLRQIVWFPAITALWLLSAILVNIYDAEVTTRPRITIKALIEVAAIFFVVYLVLFFLSPPNSLPRRFVLYFLASSVVLVGTWRILYIRFLGLIAFQRRAILVASDRNTDQIIQVIKDFGNPHYVIVGSVNDGSTGNKGSVAGLPVLGSSDELPGLVDEYAASEIIVNSLGTSDENLLRNLIDCQEKGVQITPLPAIYEELTGRIPLNLVPDGWLSTLPFQNASTGVIFPTVKRSIDIALAVLGLLTMLVLFPITALLIRLDSPGPILFGQDRIGKGGRVFRAYKFRSMTIRSADENQPLWTMPRDARVTRIGRILRATHIDEFPQFLNILKGEMSAVGPRPEREELTMKFEKAIPFYRMRHSVRPGMAGWALNKQGNTNSIEEALTKLEYDLYYIKHQSLWLDMSILIRTFLDAATLRGK